MFIYFARCKIDYLILETGMGGTDDATNVVNSQFNIITNISLEHTGWLGNSLAEIAKHKAGIINPTALTIVGDTTDELISAVTAKTNNYLNINDKYQFTTKLDIKNYTTHLRFTNRDTNITKNIQLSLFGDFQAYNFLCAYEVLTKLKIDYEIIKLAAQTVNWPGRMQIISQKPLIIADASHNANGSANLVKNLISFNKKHNSIIICSILKDKDQRQMLDNYSQISDSIIFCQLTNQPRASSPNESAALAQDKFINIHIIESPLEALQVAKNMQKDLILISGSTYLLKNFI